jgi:hypothetical protein
MDPDDRHDVFRRHDPAERRQRQADLKMAMHLWQFATRQMVAKATAHGWVLPTEVAAALATVERWLGEVMPEP